MSESPPFPLTELIAASPSETFLRFISSNASVVTRSVCKSFNERASSFCSEKKTRVTEEVVHACSFSLVRWLLTLPRPPEPEQLLFALAQMKGGEEMLALLAGTSPTHAFVLRPEAQLSWQSLSHFSNFSAVLRGAVWENNRDLFARFLPRLAEVVGADGILTAVLGCGMLGWLPKGIAADRRWILSLFSQHFQANLRAGIFLRARDLETLVGFPLSALEDLASNLFRIVTEFGPL